MTTRPNREVTQSTPADVGTYAHTHTHIYRIKIRVHVAEHTHTPCSSVVCKYRNKVLLGTVLR